MQLEQLRARAQAFTEAVAREGYLAYAGHQEEARLQAIYDAYAELTSADALALCREHFRATVPGSEAHRAARMLLDWAVDAQTGRVLAPLDEREITLENSGLVQTADGRTVPYQRVAIDIMNTTDRHERNALDAGRAAFVRDTLAPLRRERIQRERDTVESLGIADGYNATFEALTTISLGALGGACDAFLRDTAPLWHELLGAQLRAAGIPRDEATRADALALFRLQQFDDAFPSTAMTAAVRRNCEELRLDPSAAGHVTLDLDDRPGKRARAFCSPVRVPEEVYLVLRPHGGQSDWGTLLHELGHALHFGYTRADLPFEYRWLGDNSVTEGYAMLFDHRLLSAAWLVRYTGLGRGRAAEYVRLAAVEELHFVRRYCAKLLYEIQVYGGTVAGSALPDLYAQTLGEATGFRYRREDAFIDLDPRFYAARYLRAWQLQAVLDEALTERFDEDWWRNPAAGPWIIGELFGEGQREGADELALRVAHRALSFTPVARRIETLLGG